MPAERRVEGLRQLVDRGAVHDLAEFRYQGFRVDPAQVAAIERRARIFREALGQGGEAFAVLDALAQACGQSLGLGIAAHGIGLEQDVAHMHLIDDARLATALLFHLEDHEAAGDPHGLGDTADTDATDQAIEGRGQLGGFAPADLAAIEGVVAGRAGDGQLVEVGALA